MSYNLCLPVSKPRLWLASFCLRSFITGEIANKLAITQAGDGPSALRKLFTVDNFFSQFIVKFDNVYM